MRVLPMRPNRRILSNPLALARRATCHATSPASLFGKDRGPSSGVLSGTPTQAGDFWFDLDTSGPRVCHTDSAAIDPALTRRLGTRLSWSSPRRG